MMFEIDVDDRPLRKLKNNLERLEGEQRVPLADLLTPEFMSAYTSFPNIEDFLEASGLFPSEADDQKVAEVLENKRQEIDTWTARESSCGSWDELVGTAAREYIQREMFRGVK